MNRVRNRFVGGTAMIVLSLAVAACQTSGSDGGGSAAPTNTPTSQSLQAQLSAHSLSGEAISGDMYCSYYAPDGTMTRVFEGFPPESGTYTVDGDRLCETIGGVTGCNQIDIQPSGLVVLTNLEGSGAFPTEAAISPGNTCGV